MDGTEFYVTHMPLTGGYFVSVKQPGVGFAQYALRKYAPCGAEIVRLVSEWHEGTMHQRREDALATIELYLEQYERVGMITEVIQADSVTFND